MLKCILRATLKLNTLDQIVHLIYQLIKETGHLQSAKYITQHIRIIITMWANTLSKHKSINNET